MSPRQALRAGAAATLTSALLLAMPAGEAVAQGRPAFDDIVYLSCAEVAAAAGEDEALLVAMITTLAAYSLEKRGLVVPENEPDLGLRFGELIKAYCTADPDGLLYNAVHRAMLRLL